MKTDKIHTLKLGQIGKNEREISFVLKKDKHLIKQKGLLMPVVTFLSYNQYLVNLFPNLYFNPHDTSGMINKDPIVQYIVSYKATLLYYIRKSNLSRSSTSPNNPVLPKIKADLSNLYIFINTKTLKNMNNGCFERNYYSLSEVKKYTNLIIRHHNKAIKEEKKVLTEMSKYFI